MKKTLLSIMAIVVLLPSMALGQVSWMEMNGLKLSPDAMTVDSGGAIYAVSYGIFRSKDGSNWERLTPELTGYAEDTFYRPQICSANHKLFFSSYDFGCFRSNDSGRNWTQVFGQSSRTSACQGVKRDANGTIYLLHDSILLRSANYGSDWDTLFTDPNGFTVRDIAFGPAGTYYLLDALHVFVSTDSARTWRQVTAPANISLTADSGGLIVCGGRVALSHDGGNSWDTILKHPAIFATWLNGGKLIILATDTLFVSSNEGNSWTRYAITRLDTSPSQLSGKTFSVGPNGEWIIGTTNGILLSTDSGATWHYNSGSFGPSEIDIHPGRPIYGLGSYGIARSDDRAKSWLPLTYGSNLTTFASNDRSIVIGGCGEISVSTDDGNSWHQPLGNWNICVSGLTSDLDGNFYMSTEYDYDRWPAAYKSTDDGESWIRIEDSAMASAGSSIAVTPRGTVLIGMSVDWVRRSTDDGKSWNDIFFPWGNIATVPNVAAVSNDRIVFQGTATSFDDGQSWDTVHLPVPSFRKVLSVAIDSLNGLFIGLDSGLMLYSTDFGASWMQFAQFTYGGGADPNINSIAFDSANFAWAVVGNELYRSAQSVVHGSSSVRSEQMGQILRLRPNEQGATLESPIAGSARIEVYSIIGVQLSREQELFSSPGTYHLTLPSLPHGTYFLRVEIGDQSVITPVIE